MNRALSKCGIYNNTIFFEKPGCQTNASLKNALCVPVMRPSAISCVAYIQPHGLDRLTQFPPGWRWVSRKVNFFRSYLASLRMSSSVLASAETIESQAL